MPSRETWCRKGATRFLIAAAAVLAFACSPEESGNARDVADVGKSSVKVGGGEGTAVAIELVTFCRQTSDFSSWASSLLVT